METRVMMARSRQRLRRWWRLVRSIDACSMCGKPERPWRRMMVYPMGGVFANICSDACWDRIDGSGWDA